MHLVIYLVWKKCPKVKNLPILAVVIGLGIWSGSWREKDWNIGTKHYGVEACGWAIWERAQTVKSSVSHVNVHLKAFTMAEVLNNQVDEMTQPIDMNQSAISYFRSGMMGTGTG